MVSGDTRRAALLPQLRANHASVERSPDAAAVRAEVERILAFYLGVDYFRARTGRPSPDRRRRSSRKILQRMELEGGRTVNVARDGICARKPHVGSILVETEREKGLWKSTVASKLGRVPTEERRLLVEAAILADAIRQIRRRVRSVSTILGSPSKRAGMSRFDRSRMADARAIGAAAIEILARQLSGIRRRNAYTVAATLFYRACTPDPETKAYIFESFLSEQ